MLNHTRNTDNVFNPFLEVDLQSVTLHQNCKNAEHTKLPSTS